MQSSQILEYENIPFVSVAVYKKGVSNHCFNQINILYPNSDIYIVCPKGDIVKFKSLKLKNTTIINEDNFIAGINKHEFLKLFNFPLKKNRTRKSWYWMQILSFFCCNNLIIPEKYVLINSDFIMLNKIRFYSEEKAIFNKSLVPTGREYDAFIKKLVKVDNIEQGYISEYMVYEKKYLKEMLSILGSTPYQIIKNILTMVSEDKYDLADFLWYANFMFKNYPDKVTTQTIYYYRLVHTYYGHRIRQYDLAIFKIIWKLDAVCIEPWRKCFFHCIPIYRFISYLRYKFNYYGWLPFSVVPKEDPSWVYEARYPIIWKLYENKIIKLVYRFIKKIVKYTSQQKATEKYKDI